jgi:hypothetical protein
LIALLLIGALSLQPEELVERTLAIVGGQPITLSDARAAIRLKLTESDRLTDVTNRLIDRALILREVQRYAPPEPADTAIDGRMKEAAANAGGPLAAVLETLGFTEPRLREWIKDDLRSQAYLAQRFAAVGAPTEQEISTAFTQQRAEFERAGQTFEQAVPILRERLTAARRRELIADWLSDLRRRTPVVILAQ